MPDANQSIVFARETVDTVEVDIVPLMKDHDAAVTSHINKEFPLDVDVVRYRQWEQSGVLRVFTARMNGKLIGYATYLVAKSHHRKVTVAHEDALYVAPEYRRGGAAKGLMKFAEAEMPECQLVIYHNVVFETNPINRAFGMLLCMMGYKKYSETYIRMLS